MDTMKTCPGCLGPLASKMPDGFCLKGCIKATLGLLAGLGFLGSLPSADVAANSRGDLEPFAALKAESVDRKDAVTPELQSPRSVVAEWLRRVNTGTRDAWDLTTRSNNVGWGPSFTGLWEYDRIRPLHQLGNEETAIVVSNPFNDNAGQPCIFCAVLRKKAGPWLVDHHTYVSPSEASSLMTGFSLNSRVKFDVLAAELVGKWRAVCDSTISMAADGTGTQLRVGPGGPEPGVKPEPFKWVVSGSTLRRHFADRQEKLEIIWIDDHDLKFHSPNDSSWAGWWRKPPVDRPPLAKATNEALPPPE